MKEIGKTRLGFVRANDISKRRKGEFFLSRKNWQSARPSIRIHTERVISKSDLKIECKVCGYSKYVEVCHIKSVSDFPDTSTIEEINSLENLILLCPNHHWEFDHNLLKL